MSADIVLGLKIVLQISHLPSKLRFLAKCSFCGQSLSRGHYQPTYQPPEGLYLLNKYSTIFTSPKANNCFSIISELKNRENDISDISSSETWANRLTATLFLKTKGWELYSPRSAVNIYIYILLDVLVCSIAVYFYELCSILTSP